MLLAGKWSRRDDALRGGLRRTDCVPHRRRLHGNRCVVQDDDVLRLHVRTVRDHGTFVPWSLTYPRIFFTAAWTSLPATEAPVDFRCFIATPTA
jgi:hypothetical protein